MCKSFVLLALLLLALPARADNIYEMAGTATITGNDACAGPCIETLTFSFLLDQNTPFTAEVLPGGTFTSSGPIPYGSGPIPWVGAVAGADGGYIAWNYNPPGGFGDDELDLTVGCGFTPVPCTPGLFGAVLYSCGDMTCVNDFCPGTPCFLAPNYFGGVTAGPVVGTVTLEPPSAPTPEPGEASLLIVGIGLLWLACRSGMHPGRMSLSS